MAIHVKDPETDAAVRKLAAAWGVGLTEAIKRAADEALAKAERVSAREAIHALQERIAQMPRTGLKADKAFFDDLSGE